MQRHERVLAAALLCLTAVLSACEPDSPAAGSSEGDAGDAGDAGNVGDVVDDGDGFTDCDLDVCDEDDGVPDCVMDVCDEDDSETGDLPLCVLGESSLPCRLAL